jgi:hypothetical protein
LRIVSVPEDLKGHAQELDILRERLSLNFCRYFWGAFAILGIALLAAYLFDNWRIFGLGSLPILLFGSECNYQRSSRYRDGGKRLQKSLNAEVSRYSLTRHPLGLFTIFEVRIKRISKFSMFT